MFDIVTPATLRDVDLETLRFFGVSSAVALDVATRCDTADALLARLDALRSVQLTRLAAADIRAAAVLGFGPSTLPRAQWGGVIDGLPSVLLRDEVVAVGPVTLTDVPVPGDETLALELFRLARAARRPVVVSAPSPRALRRMVRLLDAARMPSSRVVVLGVTMATVKLVLARGYAAVLALRPPLLTVESAVALVRRLGPERLCVASTAGHPDAELLSLPRAAERLDASGVTGAVVRRVFERNGAAIFGALASLPSNRRR